MFESIKRLFKAKSIKIDKTGDASNIEANKTQYRIITIRNLIADRYLQFYYNGKWRFVPQSRATIIHGIGLSPDDCPTELTIWDNTHYCHSYFGQEAFSATGFMHIPKNYPDILVYFAENKKKYEAREEQKKRDADVPDVQYL